MTLDSFTTEELSAEIKRRKIEELKTGGKFSDAMPFIMFLYNRGKTFPQIAKFLIDSNKVPKETTARTISSLASIIRQTLIKAGLHTSNPWKRRNEEKIRIGKELFEKWINGELIDLKSKQNVFGQKISTLTLIECFMNSHLDYWSEVSPVKREIGNGKLKTLKILAPLVQERMRSQT